MLGIAPNRYELLLDAMSEAAHGFASEQGPSAVMKALGKQLQQALYFKFFAIFLCDRMAGFFADEVPRPKEAVFTLDEHPFSWVLEHKQPIVSTMDSLAQLYLYKDCELKSIRLG